MRYSVNPKQRPLFDPDIAGYSEVALRRLREDWPGLFRECILELMPVDLIEDRFHEYMGRPTKELYSMCGLVFLMEFRDWTTEEAADMYMFDQRVHFALNRGHDQLAMTTRTIERYRALFREKECAAAVMDRVTRRLVELLGISVERQRLDSTHVLSNMALFGRTRLMMAVVRRFLTQVRRHDPECFAEIPESLRLRYEKKNWEFATGGQCRIERQQVAEDMLLLIGRFETIRHIMNRTSFKDLVRVFDEQCELVGDKVTVRDKTRSSVMQNPSDPDATYDGYKGAGYQVQVSETCGAENDVQLVVAAIPQSACEQDHNAMGEVLDSLEQSGHSPKTILADCGYGSDQNVQKCAERNVELIAPVNKGGGADRLALKDFQFAADHRVLRCPAGRVPVYSRYRPEQEQGRAAFEPEGCSNCVHLSRCPVFRHHQKFCIKYSAKELRLAERRTRFAEPDCRKEYAMRSGIEGTFSRAKAVTGLGRLRVRGMPAVSMALFLKLAGLNILRALGGGRLHRRLSESMSEQVAHRQFRFVVSSILDPGALLAA